MSNSRILPDVSFSVPAKNCVVCGNLTVDCGIVPLCSHACVSEWANRDRPPLDEFDREIADRLAKAIEENLKTMLDDEKRPTCEQVVEATKKAVVNIITIEGTVTI